MLSSPLYSTHVRTTSSVPCHLCPWVAQTVGQRRALYAINSLGQYTRSDDVGSDMLLLPFDYTYSRMTSSVAFPYGPWATYIVERLRALHAIIAHRQNIRSDDVEGGMPSSSLGSTHDRNMSGVTFHHCLGKHTRSNDVGRGMSSSPLESIQDRTMLGVACYHFPWTKHTIEPHRAWHAPLGP